VSIKRISGLDGLRAISVLAVILGHVIHTQNGPIFLGALHHIGNLGVRIFFVISGFLITTLLLKELEASGSISIRNFYKRRSFRILPAFVVYVAAVYLLYVFGMVALKKGDLFHTLTFTMNYHHERAWALNHLWSLSVEEQFYFVWPFLLLVTGYRASGAICLFVVVATIAVRYVMIFHFNAVDSQLTREFQAVVDAMAMGALISIYGNKLLSVGWYKRLLSSPISLVLAAIVLGASMVLGIVAKPWFYVIGQTAANIAIALLVHYTVSNANSVWGRVMENPLLVQIGLASFSLYLWQEIFLSNDSTQWFAAFPQNLAFTFIIGFMSYKFVEQPFIRLYRSK
jgi:peptidoglycan/LPS O-acetylase OafA/YrhL